MQAKLYQCESLESVLYLTLHSFQMSKQEAALERPAGSLSWHLMVCIKRLQLQSFEFVFFKYRSVHIGWHWWERTCKPLHLFLKIFLRKTLSAAGWRYYSNEKLAGFLHPFSGFFQQLCGIGLLCWLLLPSLVADPTFFPVFDDHECGSQEIGASSTQK